MPNQKGQSATINTALMVQYDSAFGAVTLTPKTVMDYLVRGNAAVTEQEIILFMELCKFQKLNPFTNEVYLIKFGSEPAQMVVGRDAYLRRAYENPDYLGYTSGMVVLRGNEVIQKPGTCLYPNEKVIGGWCRVRRKLNGAEVETFKEVSLEEYNKGQANWKTKPGLMISKVAESQALRAAFPTDYAGLYTAEEFGNNTESLQGDFIELQENNEVENADPIITQEQRKAMFALAKEKMGGEKTNENLQKILAEFGLSSTAEMPLSVYTAVMERIETWTDLPPEA